MTRSKLIWLMIPLAIALGATAGVLATRRLAPTTTPQAPPLALAEPPRAEAEAEPTPVPPSGRSPFEEMPTIPGSTSEPKLVAMAEITETVPEFAAGPPEFNPPPGYFDLPAPDKKDGTDPPIITNGQVIAIEILEALPGRPLNGDRVVRPDGTISLGFYGDLRVAGLNRYQIKVKLIEHMRRYLNDEILGLWRIDPATNKYEPVPPVESGRVLVDESPNYHPAGIGKTPRQSTMEYLLSSKPQIDELRGEIARLRKELNDLREEQKSPRAEPPVAASKPG